MAPALFLKKQSTEKEDGEELNNLLGRVRTMKDDLEDIRLGKQGTPQPQAEKQKSQSDLLQKTTNPFSEAGEKILQTRAQASDGQPGNPFGVAPRNKSGPISNVPQYPSVKNGLSGLASDGGGVLINRPKRNNQTLLVAGIVILTLAIISAGVFYFYSQRNQGEISPLSPDETSNIPEKIAEVPSKEPLLALDKPNYLSFNTETVSPEDIKKILSQAALRVKAGNITRPVEFLVTDQNNNPLAFNRFAFLLKLNLAPDVAALANEAFSLYAYNDASRVRFGLALTFKDAPAAALAIAKVENTLPSAFEALIFEPNIQIPKEVSLSSGTYNQFTIHFVNIDNSQNVSFDYVLDGNQWFIGTSKNTMHAILDAYARQGSL
ncbi:MAG: hypothetical protein Q7S04_04425 [Candidatus Moranbacteria bacterium]|nr:hypothetical protein [Candidatus Moranbacteria bacterium]